MYNKIQFIVANHTKPSGEKELVPRLKSGNAEELMDLYGDVRQSITGGTMVAALYTLRDTLVEIMSSGSSIHLPGLGTFALTLGGRVEEQGGKYVGRDVHVDGLRFTPDESLLAELRSMEVDQTPLPVRPYVDSSDLSHALGDIVSPHRLSDLLATLVKEGRLHREGTGSQTRYRKA